MMQYIIQPGGCLQGTFTIPGDKSISHRAIMLGALAKGTTYIERFLTGQDALATLNAFRLMGVNIVLNGEQVKVEGVGLNGLQPPLQEIDCGNSGTSMRLLSGILAAQPFNSTLTGDASLQKRPMSRVIVPLTQMGAKITAQGEEGRAPLHITGKQKLKGIDYSMPMASAQVKSALLLAGLYAKGKTTVIEPAMTRDHTERMLRTFGYHAEHENNKASVIGGGCLMGARIVVPGDMSSAAFFIVGATIAPRSEIVLKEVGINPTRVGIIHILRMMGANIQLENEKNVGGERVADIVVKYAKLSGIDIPTEQVPLAIDEFPIIFIAAACATGITTLRNAKELRVKESDRLEVMAKGLKKLGIKTQVREDGIEIEGGQLIGGHVESEGDHRIAMAFAIAGLRANGDVIIDNCTNVSTSFPNFVTLAQQSGINITVAIKSHA